MVSNYKLVKLKELINLHYGSALKAEERTGGNIPVYGSNGIVGYHNESLINSPTVIIGRKGSVGAANFSDESCWAIDTSYYTEVKSVAKLDLKYFYYFAKSVDISLISQKGVKPGVNRNDYLDLEIPLPSLIEQKSIVSKLDKLYKLIDRVIVLLEENNLGVQHLMSSVFNEVISNLDCNKAKLGDVCILNPPKSEVKALVDLEVSFLPMADLNEFRIDFIPHQEKKLKEVYTGYTYFRDEDVLLAKVTPCFENGKSGIAKGLKNGIGFGSSEYYVLRCKEGVIPEYIYHLISSSNFLISGAQNMSGAVGLKRVTKDFLSNYEVPLPTVEVQYSIVNYLTKVKVQQSALLNAQKDKVLALKALKESILDAAFKGELSNVSWEELSKQSELVK